MKFCEKCGNQLLDEAVMCPKCKTPVGSKQSPPQPNEQDKSAVKSTLAVLLAIAIIATVVIIALSQYYRY